MIPAAKRVVLLIGPILTAAVQSTAVACPLCDSPVAQAVRSGLVDDDLPRTLAAIMAPFAGVGVLGVLIAIGPIPRGGNPRTSTEPDGAKGLRP